MKLLVLSDLHAISQPDANGAMSSYVSFCAPRRTEKSDPLVGLRTLLGNGSVPAPDLFICAGDLANRADALAISNVWRELGLIQSENRIPQLVATCGNHDLDTRHRTNKFDPHGFLKSLEPPFPNPTNDKQDRVHLEYWANNFYVWETDDWRLLNINSCAYHGFGSATEPELLHGRISDYTLDEIEATLRASVQRGPLKKNICLFHHHLRDVSTDEFEDRSVMKGASRLLSLLSQAGVGEWFVIHGHRHRSDLYYAGGSLAPIVLSCVSFSATRTGDENNPCPNQFYFIEITSENAGGYARAQGLLKSWSWTPGAGWQCRASIPGGLPVQAGFGFRGDVRGLADRICDEVLKAGRLTWVHALELFPELKYFVPSDLEGLGETLMQRVDVVVSREETAIREIVSVS